MAYQSVDTPKFFINILEWYDSLGHISLSSDQTGSLKYQYKLRTLPIKQESIPSFNITGLDSPFELDFIAVLGHTLGSQTRMFRLASGGGDVDSYKPHTELVNLSTDGRTPYDGFSIIEFDGLVFNNFWFVIYDYGSNYEANIGSIVVGSTYTMPSSPNLELTMTRDYGESKEFTTYNGSSMSNTMISKPPSWGSLGAWELSTGSGVNQALSRSGRRSWDLKFSYMDDGDLWGVNQMLSTISPNTAQQNIDIVYESGDVTGNVFNDSILTDENFFSQVWHKTLGGTLPFIFNPSGGGNNNPDMFAICRFKENSLKATQSAFNVYDISVSIEEVW